MNKALRQTVYVEFKILAKKDPADPNGDDRKEYFHSSGTTFSEPIHINFDPDYMKIKQMTHFSSDGNYDLNMYYISSNLLPDMSKIFAVVPGNYNSTADLFFPIGKSVRGSFDFIIRSMGDGNNLDGSIILALEFTKHI